MMNEKTPSSSSLPSLEQSCQLFSFAELSSATNNFDEKWCIGYGGSSKVYKGIFSDKTTNIYAIKRLHFMSDQGAPEFWVEVKMLSRLRHCNLVSLVGYCDEGNEMALVYEYMPHGTLYGHLHKKTTPLTWSQRLKICLGAARGMDYLHTGTGIQHGIIHRDVKSSNILLDENYAAKIADFGLAKIGPINQTLTYVSTGVKGTFGYMDPNYFYTGRLTRKSDVYAFGVVLLEVLCGRPALDESLDEGLAVWAQDHIKQGKLTQIIDSSLRNHISKSSLKVFSRIAARCLLSHPNQRPTMSEVVGSLDLALSFQERKDPSTQGRITSKKVWSLFTLKGHFELKSPGLTSTPEIKEINSSKAMSETVSMAVATIVNTGEVDLKKNLEEQDANNDPLPAIEDLRIYGDAFPGEELQACGYHINGAVSCMFQWTHYNSDGSCEYIQGETKPTYTVGLGDVGTYLGVEVVPMDVNGRKGTRIKCFANRGLVITNASLKGHFELKSSGLTSTPESKEVNGKKAISETVSIAVATIVNTDQVDLKKNLEGQDANNDPLPAIEDLRISGDAFPGEELQACGYQVNGAVSCFFKWAHYNSDGSCKYIEGETNPTYIVGLGDVGSYLGVEVVPMDVNGRKGTCLKCFANRGLVITYASQ